MDSRPIFLIGFMATGKTTVGRQLAARLGRRFLDLDEEIERIEGRRIAEIFAQHGEAAFRRMETAALARVATEPDAVVSCGGGTPCFGENLARMRAAGVVVALGASLEEIVRRAAGTMRPLLPDAERLYEERAAVYRSADVKVSTDNRLAQEVTAEVARRAALRLGDVTVALGERSYPIAIAPLARARELAAEYFGEPTSIAVVTDENVAAAGHAGAVAAALGARATIAIPPGERSKSLAQVERVAAACIAAGLDRRSAIVAVGGGVVGDLAGFVAAILYRGVAVAHVPTSLLAMVDSSIGGKTGVDLPAGKNLAGAFWQPRFVLADPATLATLPARERRAALAEVLKVGLLADPELFAKLGAFSDEEIVLRAARIKAGFVARDERETTGQRALLNLGHTIGHAIEAASRYKLLHGEAVGLGLVAAARVSRALGLCDASLVEAVTGAVRSAGLDVDLAPWLRDDVFAFVSADKKRAGGKVRFVAPLAVGQAKLVDLELAELSRILRSEGGA